MTGEPAAQARLHLAEGQVDLVVHDDQLVEVEPVARRARARRRGRTRSCRSAGAAAPRAGRRGRARPRSRRPPNAFRARGSSQRRPSSVRDLEADVVAACRRSATPGLPSPTIRKSTGAPVRRPRNSRRRVLLGALCRRPRRSPPRRPRRPRPRRLLALADLALLADQRRLLLDLLGLLDSRSAR